MHNRRKIYTLAGILLLIASSSMAQSYVEEAMIFSRTRPGGSARIQAIGGAQVALGGDYSSALSNPAGLGMYNRSEFTFSPGVMVYQSSSSYLGNLDKDSKTVFNIPGVSIVLHGSKDKNGFLGGSFALSMSRVNDFQGVTAFHGINKNNSIIDSYINQANGSTTAQFDSDGSQYNTPTGLAYFNYLIGPQSILNPSWPDDEYFTDAPIEAEQHTLTKTKGATNQWNISYGGNYKDIIFFGGAIGITSLRYKSEQIFNEYFESDTISSLSVTENLKIKGAGINATIGFILKPVSFFQIGASFTTPTLYSITDTYDASMKTSWNAFDYYDDGTTILNDESASTDAVISEYNLTTPLKVSAGVAFISKFGFISGDIELTNAGQTRYSSSDQLQVVGIDFSQDNADIKSLYKTAFTYRIGGEFRYQVFRARAGFGVQGNGYQKDSGIDNSVTTISGGLGIRTKTYFVDFALINSSQNKYSYQPYFTGGDQDAIADIKKKTVTGMFTIGFIF